MKMLNLIKIVKPIIVLILFLFSQSLAFGQNHIVPISATTTAGQFSPATGIEYIYYQATGVSDPLTDPYVSICGVGSTQAYISSFGNTTGTITVTIPSSNIDALHVWNGWSTSCELNHSLNSITLSFYSLGTLMGTEVLTVPLPDGSGFGFFVPLPS